MENLCIILNKRIKWLERLIKKINPDVYFLYSSIVYDMNCQTLRVRKHDDGELYMFGKRLRTDDMYYVDCHVFHSEIPFGRYIYMRNTSSNNIYSEIPSGRYIYTKNISLDNIDLSEKTVIAMPDKNDFESYLAISAYLKTIGYDHARFVQCIEIDGVEHTGELLSGFLSGSVDLPYFETMFAKIFDRNNEEGFISQFPISRDIRYLQNESGMNNIKFAAYFGTSIRNVENWRRDPSSLKDYVYDLFEYKLLKEGII